MSEAEFASLNQARQAGYDILRIEDGGILMRRQTPRGDVFGWIALPARRVRGMTLKRPAAACAKAAPAPKKASGPRNVHEGLWFRMAS